MKSITVQFPITNLFDYRYHDDINIDVTIEYDIDDIIKNGFSDTNHKYVDCSFSNETLEYFKEFTIDVFRVQLALSDFFANSYEFVEFLLDLFRNVTGEYEQIKHHVNYEIIEECRSCNECRCDCQQISNTDDENDSD